jgi:hypothetical protein
VSAIGSQFSTNLFQPRERGKLFPVAGMSDDDSADAWVVTSFIIKTNKLNDKN